MLVCKTSAMFCGSFLKIGVHLDVRVDFNVHIYSSHEAY